jgi:hypothetical protein
MIIARAKLVVTIVFIVQATVITHYDHKTFIVQATDLQPHLKQIIQAYNLPERSSLTLYALKSMPKIKKSKTVTWSNELERTTIPV